MRPHPRRWRDLSRRARERMIFHIVKRAAWMLAGVRERCAPACLRAEGFVLSATPTQVIYTANWFYPGQDDLVVLCIDESRVKAELKSEAPAMHQGEQAGELFPHLYGELNVDAVVRVVELPCEADGSFRLPEELRILVV